MNCHLPTYRLVFATAIALTGIGRADSSEQFELREATIADIQAAYRAGILSPQHLVSMYLARIAALDRSDLPQPLDGGEGCLHRPQAAACGGDHPRQGHADGVRQFHRPRHAHWVQLAASLPALPGPRR